MNKVFVVILVLLSHWFSAQIDASYQKAIDSLNHQLWSRSQLDLDSLSNPVYEPLNIKLADTIYANNTTEIRQASEEMPITPFVMNKYDPAQKWYFYGQNDLTFNQASFSNWNSGGENNIGIKTKVNYNLSYKSHKSYVENLIQLGYGWLATKGQSNRKTEDVINYALNYGYDLGRDYYLSAGFQFLSQFSPGFDYGKTPDPSYEDRISKFLAPGYFNVGLGVSYNPSEKLQVILRPASGKFTYVGDPLLQKKGRYGLKEDGDQWNVELGAMLNFVYRLKVYKKFYVDHQLGLFSNYLFHPERVDVMYKGVVNLKFNDFITTMITLDLVYDHDQIQSLQHKQTLGLGISYTLGAKLNNEKIKKKKFNPFISN